MPRRAPRCGAARASRRPAVQAGAAITTLGGTTGQRPHGNCLAWPLWRLCSCLSKLRLRPARLCCRDVAAEAGVSFQHARGARGNWHPVETMGSGVAVLDYDGDGAPDLFFVQGGEVPGTGHPPGTVGQLYRNGGDGRFRDVSEAAGFGAPAPVEGHGMGAVAADYDNDGDADLLVTRAGTDLLFENRGDGTFGLRDAGLNAAGWSASAAFSDLDGDGDLDLFITHYLDWSPANNPVCARTIAGEPVRSYCLPDAFSGVPDLLYENRGDGSFADVTEAAGVGLRTGKGLGVLAADLIGDGLPDLYVANDTVPNFLFENLGGLRFRERGLPAGVAYDGDGNALAGMGIAAADIESDGDLDLFVTNFQGEANNLYVSDRHGVFRDVSFLSGVGRPSLDWLGFGAVFADLDNDGAQDLCVTNGHVLDNAPVLFPGTAYRQRGRLFPQSGWFVRAGGAGDAPGGRPGPGDGRFRPGRLARSGGVAVGWNARPAPKRRWSGPPGDAAAGGTGLQPRRRRRRGGGGATRTIGTVGGHGRVELPVVRRPEGLDRPRARSPRFG